MQSWFHSCQSEEGFVYFVTLKEFSKRPRKILGYAGSRNWYMMRYDNTKIR